MLEDTKFRFAVDLTRNYRLIFSPAEPYEYREGLGIIKESVKAIIVEEVSDYH
ncbi:MAG: hypothetical protein HY226_01670 [Candidatus Vogelbacteria bacterium]|nr:hypothetical protein [Candidatus Vogelbacteria bacterium]